MAIRILHSVDPLSEAALDPLTPREVILADSEAGRVLLHELERYCAGGVNGKSFLVAGHRGAGKTTMVADVLTRLIVRQRRAEVGGRSSTGAADLGESGVTAAPLRPFADGEPAPLRPLPVFIHGPKLFEGPAAEHETTRRDGQPGHASADPDITARATDRNAARLRKSSHAALVEIVLGLHRAVVREYARAMRDRLMTWHADPPVLRIPGWLRTMVRPVVPPMSAVRRAELAAQFDLEISEQSPAEARLRDFYRHAGALNSGILRWPARRPGQGMRELLALHGVLYANQRISGELRQSRSESSRGSMNESTRRSLELRGRDWLRPAGALGVGGAVAAALHWNLWAEGLAGLVATLVAGWSLGLERRQETAREYAQDITFLPRLDLETLDRVVPVLLARLQDAGLAPVIVIDELDKVRPLAGPMEALVRDLKKLLAENVLTCFLADRAYLENVLQEAREKAYGVTSSYFSHVLLVAFEPADFDHYLERILERPQVPGAEGVDVDPESREAALARADAIDREVLKMVLRHRSELHSLKLQRELSGLRSREGMVALAPGAVRTDPIYRIDATLQYAIELQLMSPRVRGWIRQQPERRSLLFDALYYISRSFRADETAVDVGAAPEGALARYLTGRVDQSGIREPAAYDLPPAQSPLICNANDLEVLAAVVAGIAQFLAQTRDVADAQRAWEEAAALSPAPQALPGEEVRGALLLGPTQRVMELAGDVGATSFRFRYRSSGEQLTLAARSTPSVAQSGAAQAPESMHESVTALAAPAMAEPVGPMLSEVIDASTTSREYLQAFTKVLARLIVPPDGSTARPEDRVFDFLQDRCRVLPTSPAWQQVRTLLTQIEGAGASGRGDVRTLQAAVQQVDEFALMLSASQPIVLELLEASALLAPLRERKAPAVPSLRTAMVTVAEALHFDEASPGSIENELGRLLEGLGRRLDYESRSSGLPVPEPTAEMEVQPAARERLLAARTELQERLDACAAIVTAAREAGLGGAMRFEEPAELADLEAEALGALLGRIDTTWLQEIEPWPGEVEIVARLCLAASRPTLFAARLTSLGLVTWSQCLLPMFAPEPADLQLLRAFSSGDSGDATPAAGPNSPLASAAQPAVPHLAGLRRDLLARILLQLGAGTLTSGSQGNLASLVQGLPAVEYSLFHLGPGLELAHWAGKRPPASPDCLLVVVRRKEGSLTQRWVRRPQGCLALVLTEAQLLRLLDACPRLFNLANRLVIGWEFPADSARGQRTRIDQMQMRLRGSLHVALAEQASPGFPVPLLIQAEGPDTVVDWAGTAPAPLSWPAAGMSGSPT